MAQALVLLPGEAGQGAAHLPWWSSSLPAPARAARVGDDTRAAVALGRARAGEGLAFFGDWHGARQLLAAMGRRLDPARPRRPGLAELFLAERETRRTEREVLSRLAVPVGPGWRSPLRRAPALEAPLGEAFGDAPTGPALMPLREILGAIGAHEWRRRGVPVPALGGRVHPYYGVFAPVRGEYVELFQKVLLARRPAFPDGFLAFDVGTGTGVLALLLARQGARVVGTDQDPRAVLCARDNAARFGVERQVEVLEADLVPDGRARLVVANPPWIPAEAHGPLDRAVYDPGGELLARLVRGLPGHLEEDGEAWLVLSDLAELLGLRPEGTVLALAEAAGLEVASVHEERPLHPRAREGGDPIARARSRERTRLYVLRPSAPRG